MLSIFRHDGQLNELELTRIGQQYAVPAYVQQAPLDETLPTDVSQFPGTVFGDPASRSFACHSKAACYLALVDFAEQRDAFAASYARRVEAQLQKHAAAWGILPDADAVRNTAAALRDVTLSHLPNDHFALVRQLDNGELERRYPLRNHAEIKTAAAWLVKYAYELPYSDRHLIAQRVIERAEDVNVSLSSDHYERLEVHAGRGMPDREKLARSLYSRARYIPDAAIRDELHKTAGLMWNAPPEQILDPVAAIKMAENLDSIDRLYNLVPKYGREIPTPEESIYTCSFKTAAATLADAVQLVSGDVYTRDDLGQLNLPQLRDTFGQDIADQCTSDGLFVDTEKLAEMAETFPLPDARTLSEMLNDVGAVPLTKSAATAPRATHADWAALARV